MFDVLYTDKKRKSIFLIYKEVQNGLVAKSYMIKGESDTRFLPSGFFHKSVSLGPLSIPLGPFKIFSKICGDIGE
jgi:hypothetical protein